MRMRGFEESEKKKVMTCGTHVSLNVEGER
jgi:hypothetical protein